jgi:hypothetical protein
VTDFRTVKLTTLDTEHLLRTKPPPIDWLAEGVFARSKLCMLGGREKQGKSMLALAISVCGAMGGGAIAGIPVKPMKVLIVDAENGEEELHRRLHAMQMEIAFADNLVLDDVRGLDLRQDITVIEDEVREHSPDLLVLDSYRSLWTGDENVTHENAAALDPLRVLAHDARVGVALTHHSQKNGQEYRGSSAIGACVEWVVMLGRVEGDDDRYRRRLTNPLARFARERDDRWLRLVSEDDDGPVSVDAADPYVPEREAPVRNEMVDALRGLSFGLPPIGTGQEDKLGQTQSQLARLVGCDPASKPLRAALKQLAELGEWERDDDKRWRPVMDPATNGHKPQSAIDDDWMNE